MEGFLGIAARVLFLCLGLAVLALHALGLPANWILLGLALAWGLATGMVAVGWGTLGVLAGLAVLGEVLENLVGLVYAARRGATRWGLAGAFLGGLAGALALASVVPPLGSVLGAFLGAFGGAVLLEYVHERRLQQALRSGRAAFLGKVLAAALKTVCGFWMWCVLAYRLFAPR